MKWSFDKKRRVAKIALIVVFVVYIIHATWNSVALYNCQECSAPWYVELLLSTVIFAIPILILTVLNVSYYYKSKS
jgi:heme/copper-type cytochrome/quinol oxidase subunit 2